MHELQRVWWRDVPTLEVFHIVILLFLPRSGSISLTPLTGHWPCEAKSPDPGLGQRGARAWDQDQFFLRNVAALWCISSDTYEWLVLRLPTFTSTRKKFTNCVMPRPRYGAGFALTEHTERFRWRPTDIKWRWKNSIFSSKVIFTQLSRGNIVTKCLLLSFLKLECQTNLFLGNYLYSGGAQVHGQRVMERVADHEVLYCSSAAHKIVIGTEIFFWRQWESLLSDRFS